MNIKDYLEYFENLAIQHEGIDHDGDDENGRGFYYVEWEQYLNDLVSGVQLPGTDDNLNTIMHVIAYNWGIAGNESNLLKDKEAGFSILQYVDEVNDFEQIAEALNNTEQIAGDIIQRMRYDALVEDHPLFSGELNLRSFNCSPILRHHSNYYGVVVQFEIKTFMPSCVDGRR